MAKIIGIDLGTVSYTHLIESDMRFYYEKVESCRNFTNKVWNAARFVLMNAEGIVPMDPATLDLADEDRWILRKLDETIADVNRNIDAFDLGLAAQSVYEFLWDYYCDWYIEMSKARLNGSPEEKAVAVSVLLYVLERTLKLLHPFTPFITEEIYQRDVYKRQA